MKLKLSIEKLKKFQKAIFFSSKIKKSIVITFTLLLVFSLNNSLHAHALTKSNEIYEIIYFYINSCSTCEKMEFLLDEIQKNKCIKIVRKNISNKYILKEFNEYLEKYGVPYNKRGIVPAVFIDDKCYIGEKEIKAVLNEISSNFRTSKSVESKDSITGNKNKIFRSLMNIRTLSVLGAGILDGCNPCAISMLLFYLSYLLINERKKVLFVGSSFIIGTFISYFLLGTILYSFLEQINISMIRKIVKYLFLSFVFILLLFNIRDYVKVKKAEYGEVVLQLPLFLRRFSHNLIKKFAKITSNIYLMLFLAFFLGVIISLTEFLCTGQIYLPTLVTLIQLSKDVQLNLKAILLLVIYNLGFIIPLIIICITVFCGKKVFDISEKIRGFLPSIKFVNVMFFAIMFLIIILYF